MKKEYKKPEITVEILQNEDIITASGGLQTTGGKFKLSDEPINSIYF